MELVSFPALVIRECDFGENDKLVTLLCAERGRITVNIKGGKSLKNKNSACAQLFCYSDFTVKEKNGFYTLSEASLIRQFFEVRANLENFALAQYVSEVCCGISVENENSAELLSLALNTLHLLCKGERDRDFIKAVFELRLLSISGFSPDLSGCPLCDRADHEIFYLDVMNGTLRCGDCFGSEADMKEREGSATAVLILPLEKSVLAAMRYVISAPPKKVFSFSVEGDSLRDFSSVCEKYLTNQLERGFNALEFYKRVIKLS